MKQKSIVSIFIATLTTIAVIGIGLESKDYFGYTDTRANFTRDCSYYFADQNGYTSLYEINQNYYNQQSATSYKTWGTVTSVFRDASNNFNFYIQSTDKNNNVAAMSVFQSARTDIVEGNVVTITGGVTAYNNLLEFSNPIIEIDTMTNLSPVTTYETTSSFWTNGTNSTSLEFINVQSMGTRKVAIRNGVITHVSSGNATIISGSLSIPIYYGNLANTSSIATKITAVSGSSVDVIGFTNANKTSGGAAKLQLLIRDARDIIGGDVYKSSLLMNSSTTYRVGSYSTGNYGPGTVGGYGFEHYRVTRSYSNFLKLLPNLSGYNDGTTAGAFYNVEPIYDIGKIKITYTTDLSSGVKPTVNYGVSRANMTSSTLDFSSSSTSVTLSTEGANYFSVETTDAVLTILSLEINYSNIYYGDEFEFLPANSDEFRINPVVYDGIPTIGSTVNVPTSVTRNGSSYTVNEFKTYTYYTFDYIEDNPALVELAAYTEPADLAAYYTAFKTWPANFVVKGDYSNARSIFGDKARCVSTYSRTDGYALTVPYKNGTEGTPRYHELDVALDSSYSSNNRGVGRVVVWEYGFDSAGAAVGYDNNPVAVYTDDHYATFQEYLNTGRYGTRFNSEMNRTIYLWGLAATL